MDYGDNLPRACDLVSRVLVKVTSGLNIMTHTGYTIVYLNVGPLVNMGNFVLSLHLVI